MEAIIATNAQFHYDCDKFQIHEKKEVSAVSPWTLLYVLRIIRILPIRLFPETPLLVPAH